MLNWLVLTFLFVFVQPIKSTSSLWRYSDVVKLVLQDSLRNCGRLNLHSHVLLKPELNETGLADSSDILSMWLSDPLLWNAQGKTDRWGELAVTWWCLNSNHISYKGLMLCVTFINYTTVMKAWRFAHGEVKVQVNSPIGQRFKRFSLVSV